MTPRLRPRLVHRQAGRGETDSWYWENQLVTDHTSCCELGRRLPWPEATIANAVAIGVAKAAEADADAELLSLKPEVDNILGEWVCQMTKDCLDHKEWAKVHRAKFGFEPGDKIKAAWSPAYDCDVRLLIHEFHSGMSEDEQELRHWDRITDKLYPLAEKVLSFKASTLDGLRLQTRVLIIYHNEIWPADQPSHRCSPPRCLLGANFSTGGVSGDPNGRPSSY
jgi:hypothetical protein